MISLIRRLKANKALARLALIQSEQTLKDVTEQGKRVKQVTNISRVLREENHFRETLMEALKW